TVVEDFTFAAPKTKEFLNVVKNLKLDNKKLLLVFSSQDKNVSLSLRNVPGASMMQAADLNTYAILNNGALVLTESSIEVVNKF
ncbi:MAG: 50S ribosomal protein L4, partial [Muribaculaceae bacterium]|nr:50S ribosomal protein L4 [Muribaculaceae bacterium]